MSKRAVNPASVEATSDDSTRRVRPFVGRDQAWHVARVVEAIVRSDRIGGWVEIS
jgi:hypothetical protein